MDRRTFIRGMCAGGLATFSSPLATLASVPARGKLVFVLLRGGLDGLAAVVPWGDPDYKKIRQGFSFSKEDVISLSATFALAPGLAPLQELWQKDELAIVQAMAIPYRTRSHFDGQAVLETGLDRPKGSSDGWLNRLLQVLDGDHAGIAVAAGLPRSMSGPHSVSTWSPTRLGVVRDNYLENLHALYRADRILADRFEAALGLPPGDSMETGFRSRRGAISPILQATADFLKKPDGPNIAAVEFSGWDTHANQGLAGGALDRLLGQLAGGIVGFRKAMGESWQDTTLVVMTEFGRTARPNGTGGTDHGTAGVGLVAGPRVSRSRVLTDWPGLSSKNLYEDRDLRPTLDTRAVLKAALAGTFDMTVGQLNRVFPGSESIRPAHELMV